MKKFLFITIFSLMLLATNILLSTGQIDLKDVKNNTIIINNTEIVIATPIIINETDYETKEEYLTVYMIENNIVVKDLLSTNEKIVDETVYETSIKKTSEVVGYKSKWGVVCYRK